MPVLVPHGCGLGAVRRILPRCHFSEKNCEAGLEALAWYHERTDEHREVGLGPNTIGRAMLPMLSD